MSWEQRFCWDIMAMMLDMMAMKVVDAHWKCWIQRTVFWFCLLKLIHLGGLIFHIWIGALRFNVRCCAGVHPLWNRNDQQIGDSHLWYHRSNLPTTTNHQTDEIQPTTMDLSPAQAVCWQSWDSSWPVWVQFLDLWVLAFHCKCVIVDCKSYGLFDNVW